LQPPHPEVNPPTLNPANPSRTLVPVFLYFIAAGVATVMLGPLLPALIQRWHIQDAQAGTLFTASFVGQFCGAWFATRNLRASTLYGSAITAAGCAAMAWASFGQAHIELFCVGFGLGAGLTAGNVIAGTTVPGARARLIAMLNVAWGFGAIACPVLVRLSSSGGLQHFFFATAIFLAITSLLSIAIPHPVQPAKLTETSSQFKSHAASTKPRIPLSPLPLFVFGTALFLYVGVENSLGGWLPSYAVRTNPSLHASSISLYFWVAELIGRILVTLTVLAAFSLAPVYPLLLSFLLARTGNHARLGVLFATASIGGATLPWLTGVFSTYLHGLRAGLLVPAAGAALLLFLSTIITAEPAPPSET
jgi:FHS family glucose/mannose:H+ symporter-like MFS transporter